MKNVPIIFLILVLTLSACGDKENISLQKCWSLAERGETIQVFYPCGDDRLTPSWFRDTYRFYSNNKCEYLVLSPVDAHYMQEGLYFYDVETSILKIENLEGDFIKKYIVVEIGPDHLKLAEL
ncbi:hypothetical protein [Marivirga harenae]|uniref:hypothetical protein n=1 Tax=Marivirga harenae TaxID=2010992 RepID=UPI0026DEA1AD|nr:hypothetical protein [Marivirga harenae]WKV13771.1 hypothetical protein Q3Y49_08010 [Marivirga harenae]|tara:strand:+ start:69491 stop:69859 length:369 start_codon:yes stop_codon:yes gene_type:complete